MYDELIKRLRTEECLPYTTLKTMREAADAIEELSAYVALYKDGGETAMKVAQEYKAAYIAEHDAIELLQKTQQPKWIPVTERLPEAWEEVMLQFPNNQAAGFFDGDCGWGVFSGDDFYTYVAPEEVHPTHWAKKLPEPPKEE